MTGIARLFSPGHVRNMPSSRSVICHVGKSRSHQGVAQRAGPESTPRLFLASSLIYVRVVSAGCDLKAFLYTMQVLLHLNSICNSSKRAIKLRHYLDRQMCLRHMLASHNSSFDCADPYMVKRNQN